jgi:hypothetical protein
LGDDDKRGKYRALLIDEEQRLAAGLGGIPGVSLGAGVTGLTALLDLFWGGGRFGVSWVVLRAMGTMQVL